MSVNYEDGVCNFFAKRYDTNKNVTMILGLNNALLRIRSNYKFTFGAYASDTVKASGLIGTLNHWYVGLFNFENSNLLWTSTYYDPFLHEHSYINTYFIFDSYTRRKEINSKSKSYAKIDAGFENKVEYSFNQGIQIYPAGFLNIKGNLEIKKKFVSTMSIIIGFDFRKLVFVNEITLFHRGELKAESSGAFRIFGVRDEDNPKKWRVGLEYWYKDSPKAKKAKKGKVMSSIHFKSSFDTIQVSITVGPHNMFTVGMYVGGMVEYFEDKPNTIFDLQAFKDKNFILSKDENNWDYVTIIFFAVTETAGGLFFPILNYRANVSTPQELIQFLTFLDLSLCERL